VPGPPGSDAGAIWCWGFDGGKSDFDAGRVRAVAEAIVCNTLVLGGGIGDSVLTELTSTRDACGFREETDPTITLASGVIVAPGSGVEGVVDVADKVAEVAAAVEQGDHGVAGGDLGGAVAGGWIGGVGGRVPMGVEGGERGVGGG
jgi:hypothetical protein